MNDKPRAGINAIRDTWDYVFSEELKASLHDIVEFDEDSIPQTGNPSSIGHALKDARVVLATWGAVPFTKEILDSCPDLELILYGAGSFKPLMTPALEAREVTICTAAHINAIPTAEYTLGIILSSLKNVYTHNRDIHSRGGIAWLKDQAGYDGGYFKTKIGLVGYGLITKHLLKLLQSFDMKVFVESDHVSAHTLAPLGAEKADLEWIMRNCDVVSLHKSDIPKHHNLIHAQNLALMKSGARLINTARGRIINEEDLVTVLREGKITAFLDVTFPEPPEEDHPFYSLPNCILTPHIAGSIGREVQRMGDYCLRELRHWLANESLEKSWSISEITNRV